jgi:dihydropyrimidinase
MVSKGRLGLAKFVELTASAPAKIYNLPKKGAIVIGHDADIAIWNPKACVTLSDTMMHDRAGFTPYAGRVVTGWPDTVLLRGRVLVDGEQCHGKAGEGRLMLRGGGEAATPSGRLAAEMDEARNFGAKLI